MTGLRLLGGGIIQVAEDFDAAIEKFWPSSGAASSALQARENSTWHDEEGNRILVLPQNVSALIENYSPDDD